MLVSLLAYQFQTEGEVHEKTEKTTRPLAVADQAVHSVVWLAGGAGRYAVVVRRVCARVLAGNPPVSGVIISGSLEARSGVFYRGDGLLCLVAKKRHGGRFRPPWVRVLSDRYCAEAVSPSPAPSCTHVSQSHAKASGPSPVRTGHPAPRRDLMNWPRQGSGISCTPVIGL